MKQKRNKMSSTTFKFKSIIAKSLVAVFFLSATLLTSCSGKQEKKAEAPKDVSNAVYELYPTPNRWNFIKLNTRNGKMTMVQYSVEDDADRMEYKLSDKALVGPDKECNGRFKLHETQNFYNFILLDCIDGRTWQVQWSMNTGEQMVLPINEI